MAFKLDVLEHLKKHGSITPMQALNKFGRRRLGGRIHDLRQEGFSIDTVMIYGKNEKYAKYVYNGR